jgi:hypothetical protein
MEVLLRMPWQQEHPMWNSPGTSCTPSAWARGKETARLQVLLHCDWESQKLVWSNILLKYSLTTDVSLLFQIAKCFQSNLRYADGGKVSAKFFHETRTRSQHRAGYSATVKNWAQSSSKLK